ncbi:MAG TPA: Stp1/IreP family PP2C-type Ser/Thr phosphatase [Acidisarcina sp.]
MATFPKLESLPSKGDIERMKIAVSARFLSRKMKLMTLQYQVAAATDRGRVRPANEDAFGYRAEEGIFVVCDGMGGAAAGEVASHASVKAFLNAFADDDLEHISDRASLLREAIAKANDAVFTLAQDDPRLRGMGTTLVALLVDEDRAWVAHVGDSRCYRLRNNKLERLTDDHSLVDEQVRRGQLTAEEALNSPLRNVITRAIGSHGSVTPEINEIDVHAGDVLLLCSDGLIREVADGQIAEVLRNALRLDEACTELIDAANANGGKDNVTCLMVRAA